MRVYSFVLAGLLLAVVNAVPRRGDDGEFYLWGPENFDSDTNSWAPVESDINSLVNDNMRRADQVYTSECQVDGQAIRFHRNRRTGTTTNGNDSNGLARRSVQTRRLIMTRPFIVRWRWYALRRTGVPGVPAFELPTPPGCNVIEVRTNGQTTDFLYEENDENSPDGTIRPHHFTVFTQLGENDDFTGNSALDYTWQVPDAATIMDLPYEASPEWSDMSFRLPTTSRRLVNSLWFNQFGNIRDGANGLNNQRGQQPMMVDDIEIACPWSGAFPTSSAPGDESNVVVYSANTKAELDSVFTTLSNTSTRTDYCGVTDAAIISVPDFQECLCFDGATSAPTNNDLDDQYLLHRKAAIDSVDFSPGLFIEFNVYGSGVTAGHNLMLEYTTDGGFTWNNIFTFRGYHDGQFLENGGGKRAQDTNIGDGNSYLNHANVAGSGEVTRQVFYIPPVDAVGTLQFRQYFRSDENPGSDEQVWIIDNLYVYAPVPTTSVGAYALQIGTAPTDSDIVQYEEHVGIDSDTGLDINNAGSGEPSFVLVPSGGIDNTLDGAEYSLDLGELGNELTVELWVKLPSDLKSGLFNKALVHVTSGDAGDPTLPLFLSLGGSSGFGTRGSHLIFGLSDADGSSTTVISPSPLSTGEWHHVAGRYNQTIMELFIDGEVVSSATTSGFAVKSTLDVGATEIQPDVYIGWDYTEFNNGVPAWGITVDEFRLWSLVRTDDELSKQRFFTIEADDEGRFPPPLLLYFNFDEPEDCVGIEAVNFPGAGYHAVQYGWTRHVLSDAPISALAISDGSVGSEAAVSLQVNFASPSTASVTPTFIITNFSSDARIYLPSGVVGVVGNELLAADLPINLGSDNFVYVRANNTDECADGCDFFVEYFASVGSVNSTIGRAAALVDTSFIAREFIFPDPIEIVTAEGDAIDNTLPQALIAGGITFGVLSVGLLAVVQRRAYIARKNDRFRKLYSNPRFLLRSAFTRPYKYTASNKELFEDNRKAFFYLEELLLEDNRVLLQAVFDIMPTEEADDSSRATAYIFEGNGLARELFSGFVQSETAEAVLLPKGDAENNLFRGYSIASKMWTGYAKMGFGLNFLHKTLASTLYDVCTSHAGKVEVDEEREKKGDEDDILVSKYELLADAQKVFDAICNSVPFTPPHIRIFCNLVFEEVGINMGDHKYRAVGGFLFLRFFCPAIAVPESYGLLDDSPADYARRLLVLIAKILQNLASNVEFGIKEEYMVTMNDFLSSNDKAFRRFIEDISELPEDLEEPPPAQLPTGVREVSLFILHKFMVENKTQLRSKITDIAVDRAQADRIVKTMIKHIKRIGKGVELERDDGLSSSDSSDEDRRRKAQKKKKRRRSRSSKGSKGRRK